MRCFSDSHAHIQHVVWSATQSESTLSTSAALDLPRRLVLCGTHPHVDWPLIATLAHHKTAHTLCLATDTPENAAVHDMSPAPPSALSPRVLYGFGVHPWLVAYGDEEVEKAHASTATHKTDSTSALAEVEHASENAADMTCACASVAAAAAARAVQSAGAGDAPLHPHMTLDAILLALERHLQQFPSAIVGEIGLDKLRGPSETLQVAAFLGQMRLAARYDRPVSVHCVRHHGLLLQLLQDLPAEDTPPAIILHGFTGSTEVVKSLLKLKNKKWAVPASLKSDSSPAPRPQRMVKIKDRLFFGVGASTSFRVKGFSTSTLPLLLEQGRALLETDAHYQDGADETALKQHNLMMPHSALDDLEAVMKMANDVFSVSGDDGGDACDVMEATFDRAFASVMDAA